jgi:hypothetical protein
MLQMEWTHRGKNRVWSYTPNQLTADFKLAFDSSQHQGTFVLAGTNLYLGGLLRHQQLRHCPKKTVAKPAPAWAGPADPLC